MSPESFLLPACCSLPWLPSRSQAYWWWNHGPRCSALWVITQISSPKVELATGSTVVHVSPLLEANSAVPELVEGSRSGPQLPHGSQPLAGSSGACLPLTSPSWTWALRPEPLACPAISSYFQLWGSLLVPELSSQVELFTAEQWDRRHETCHAFHCSHLACRVKGEKVVETGSFFTELSG